MTRITIWYHGIVGGVQKHIIETDARSLMYDDPFIEPVEVRKIAKHGLVIGRMKDDFLTRTGIFIPPHRITRIDFWDDCIV